MPDATSPPQFEPPPPYKSTTAGRRTVSRRRRYGVLAAVAAVVVASGVVLAYGLFFAGSSGAKTPQQAVRRLLDAGMKNDAKKAAAALCASDRKLGQVSHLQSAGRITSYRLGDESSQDGVTFVAASYTTTANPTGTSERFPVVKDSGSWTVCFSRELAASSPNGPSAGAPSGLPSQLPIRTGSGTPGIVIPAPSNGRASLPSSAAAALCTGSTSGFGAAQNYLGAAELGSSGVAQACVYGDAVPISVTKQLSGKLFIPVTTDQNASVIVFQTTDQRTHVTVTTAREPDGRYYVTAVSIS